MALKHVFSPATSVLPCQYHSTNAPHSSSSEYVSFQKDERVMLGGTSRPTSIRISAKQWSGINNPVPAPQTIPPGHNAVSSRSPWHEHVKALSQDRKSVSKAQTPLQLQGIRVTTQQCVPQPATTATFWAGHCKSHSCLCPLCCADHIACYLSCIQLCSARSGHCLVLVGIARQRYTWNEVYVLV